MDIVAVLTDQDDYNKTRNYWKYLKAKLKKENSEVVSITTQLKLLAPDGKKRLSDMLDYDGIISLGKEFPGKKAIRFIEWFTYGDESIDGKSKSKAYALFESSFIDNIEIPPRTRSHPQAIFTPEKPIPTHHPLREIPRQERPLRITHGSE